MRFLHDFEDALVLFAYSMWRYHAQLSSSFFTLAISTGFADLIFLVGKLVLTTLAKRFYPQFAFLGDFLREYDISSMINLKEFA